MSAWRHLAELVSGGIAQVLRAAPCGISARVVERTSLVRALDYSGSELLMAVGSLAQIGRLNACKKEPETVEWLETHLRVGETLFDVGANVGAYSLVGATVAGPRCRIYAFEPSPSTFSALCQNVGLNGLGNTIIPLNVALTDRTGLVWLRFSSTAPGAAQHSIDWGDKERNDSSGDGSIRVIAFELDDLVELLEIDTPNHMKIDVDGGELAVLSGASRTLLSPALRTIMVEIDSAEVADGDVHRLLEGRGFRLEKATSHPGGSVVNCLFVRR